jgi:hypothetical protein
MEVVSTYTYTTDSFNVRGYNCQYIMCMYTTCQQYQYQEIHMSQNSEFTTKQAGCNLTNQHKLKYPQSYIETLGQVSIECIHCSSKPHNIDMGETFRQKRFLRKEKHGRTSAANFDIFHGSKAL